MAKKSTKGVPPVKEDALESGGWSPQVPGIRAPFVVPVAGQEGARAVYEMENFVGGQIDGGQEMFRDYGDAYKVSEDV